MQGQWLLVLDHYLPIPLFHILKSIERGHMSEGRLSDMGSQEAIFTKGLQILPHMQITPQHVNLPETTEISGGIGYHPVATESDRLSANTGLDDYDTLFKARHGRGALDPAPVTSKEVVSTSTGVIAPAPSSAGMIVNPRTEIGPTFSNGSLHPNQRECIPMGTDLSEVEHKVESPSSGHIIKEGAAIFTNMTETMLTALDQQMAMSSDTQKLEGLLSGNIVPARQLIGDNQMEKTQGRTQITSDPKERYPHLYLPLAENYRISDRFCGYSRQFVHR